MNQKRVLHHLKSHHRHFRFEDVSLTLAIVGVCYTMFLCLLPLI
jgi:hypothetical protein